MKGRLAATLLLTAAIAGCSDDETPANNPNTGTLKLTLNGLMDLGANARYEGWLIVSGQPRSTGVFTVNAQGVPSRTNFTVNSTDLSTATAFVLTIEPANDADAGPSGQKLLAGDFAGNTAPLTVGHSSAIGNSFTGATGEFILATPTNGVNTNG